MLNWGAISKLVTLQVKMELKIKLNLNLNSRVHCKFYLKSEILTKLQGFCVFKLKNSVAFTLKVKKTKPLYLVFSDQ